MRSSIFPFYHTLTPATRSILEDSVQAFDCPCGQPIRENGDEPYGMIYVREGTVAVLLLSEEGREVSILRLKKGDCCFLSANRLLTGISFDVAMEAESDAKLYALPNLSVELMALNSQMFASYVHKSVASDFSKTVQLLQSLLFHSLEERLAIFLYEETHEERTDTLYLTHEQIARHIGSAREVVSRALKRFAEKGILSVSRKTVTILNREALKRIYHP